jgi:hypothetical protein
VQVGRPVECAVNAQTQATASPRRGNTKAIGYTRHKPSLTSLLEVINRLFSISILSNVEAESLAFLVRIREVPGSYLGPKTGYHDQSFLVFLSPYKYRNSTYVNYVTTGSIHILSNSLLINHSTVRSYIV